MKKRFRKPKLPKLNIERRDVFIFSGLSILGYGLHQYLPWLSFSVVGSIIFLFGLMGE